MFDRLLLSLLLLSLLILLIAVVVVVIISSKCGMKSMFKFFKVLSDFPLVYFVREREREREREIKVTVSCRWLLRFVLFSVSTKVTRVMYVYVLSCIGILCPFKYYSSNLCMSLSVSLPINQSVSQSVNFYFLYLSINLYLGLYLSVFMDIRVPSSGCYKCRVHHWKK